MGPDLRRRPSRLLPRCCHCPPSAGDAATPHAPKHPALHGKSMRPSGFEPPRRNLSTQGPQPCGRTSDTSANVRNLQIARFRGRVGRIWNDDCCDGVATASSSSQALQDRSRLAGLPHRDAGEVTCTDWRRSGDEAPCTRAASSPIDWSTKSSACSHCGAYTQQWATTFNESESGMIGKLMPSSDDQSRPDAESSIRAMSALPSAGASSTDALSERWLASPEALRARQYIALLLPALILGYGGGALVVLGAQPRAESQTAKLALGVALILVGLGLTVFSIARRQEARAKFYERQERAARLGVDEALEEVQDVTDLPGLLRFNRRQMEAYESLTRRQAASSYRLSHIALAIGFALVVGGGAAAITASGTAAKVSAAGLAAIAAAVSGFLARTYLRIYERTLLQLNFYYEQPLVSSYVLTAERLVDKMGSDRRDDSLSRIIEELLIGIRVRPSGEVERARESESRSSPPSDGSSEPAAADTGSKATTG
jgi:Cyanobacterial TRADD-N associated 2-Transmembrane domain